MDTKNAAFWAQLIQKKVKEAAKRQKLAEVWPDGVALYPPNDNTPNLYLVATSGKEAWL